MLVLQDGTISMEIKLTGILSTSLLSPGEPRPSHGILVGPGVNAAAHQHLFCARLDMAVDDQQGGRDLVVSEVGGWWAWVCDFWWPASAVAMDICQPAAWGCCRPRLLGTD